MQESAAMMQQPATPAILHTLLAISCTSLTLMFIGFVTLGTGPLLGHEEPTVPTIAFAMAGISAVLIGLALFVVKPRVPKIQPGQTEQQYLATTSNVQSLNLLWFVLEGATVLSVIGYLLTGHLAVTATMLVGVALL
jgi:hypothetical protein